LGHLDPKQDPLTPGTNRTASVTDPNTWGTFEQALKDVLKRRCRGIGFVFTDTPYTGIDIDHCLENGLPNITASQILAAIWSYTEISPSGQGLHIIVKASLPPGPRRNGSAEMYDTARYFAFTGNHYPHTPLRIRDCQAAINHFHSVLFPTPPSASRPPDFPLRPIPPDQLLYKAMAARNGAKFTYLWDGDTTGHKSHSEADLALCNLLAFWTRGDTLLMDQLFKQSHLFRPKWDHKHYSDGKTYGQATIAKALHGRTDFYDPDFRS